MSDPVEILLTTDLNGSQWTCSAWDPRTGTNLMTYKGGGAASHHSLSLINNKFIITANSTKPLLHVWPINSQEQITNCRYVIPGKANAIAVSPDGSYILAAVQESIFIWQICSGKMLNVISKHYQNVTILKFTDDGSHFISGGQDGSILVWNLTHCVNGGSGNKSGGQRAGQNTTINDSNKSIEPLYAITDHALPVTDIHVGHGGLRANLFTVSLDRTCRIYDLTNGELLLNLVFNVTLNSIITNILETAVYIGSSEGVIYEFFLTSPPRNKEYAMTDEDYMNRFTGHKQNGITSLAISHDGETLASGGKDENVHLWHIPSKQLIRIFPHKGSIGNIRFHMTTRDIFNTENKYTLITANLKRMIEPINDDHIIEILIQDSQNSKIDDDKTEKNSNEWTTNSSTTSFIDRSSEIEKLRNEIQELKKVNKELFQFSVKSILQKK